MDKLIAIQNFIHVVEYKGFSAASTRLYVSASTLSRQVSYLEQQLGVPLINRSTRKLVLTAAGEQFLVEAKRITADVDQLMTARQEEQELVGSLQICYPPRFGVNVLALPLQNFLSQHPKVNCCMRAGNSAEAILSGSSDIVFAQIDLEERSIAREVVYRSKSNFVASKKYLQQHGTPKTLQDLTEHEFLFWAQDLNPSFWQEKGMRQPVKLAGRYSTDDGSLMLQWLRMGLGIARITNYAVANDLEKGVLKIIMPEYEREVAFYAYYPKHSSNIFLIQKLLEYLRGCF